MLSSGHDAVIATLIRAAVLTSTGPHNVRLVFQLHPFLPYCHFVSEVLECTGILEEDSIYATFRKLSPMLGWDILAV